MDHIEDHVRSDKPKKGPVGLFSTLCDLLPYGVFCWGLHRLSQCLLILASPTRKVIGNTLKKSGALFVYNSWNFFLSVTILDNMWVMVLVGQVDITIVVLIHIRSPGELKFIDIRCRSILVVSHFRSWSELVFTGVRGWCLQWWILLEGGVCRVKILIQV